MYIQDTKVSQNISSTSILDKFQSIVQEVQTSSINDKERQPILSLIERLKDIISPEPATETTSKFRRLKKWISRKKWVFSTATPYILKLIDILIDK